MKYGSVCSGIESASTAWKPLGWEAAFFSEIEAFPSAVLAARHPETPNLGDMTKFQNWPDYAIDLLVGGTPCQSFSIAGLRKGLADPRGNLALTFLAIVDRYRPKWVVWENVPGVHSSWSDAETFAASEESHEIIGAARRAVEATGIDLGADFRTDDFEEVDQSSDFDCFLAGLAELGYGVSTRVLDAQYVRTHSHPSAVPQRRRRVFVVGHLGDWRRAAAVLFERESLCGNPTPRREARQRPAPTLAARTRGGGGLGTDFDLDGGLTAVHPLDMRNAGCDPEKHDEQNRQGVGIGNNGDPCGTLTKEFVPGVIQCGEIVPQAMSSKWSKGSSGPAGDEVANLIVHTARNSGTGFWSDDGAGATLGTEARAIHEGTLVAHSLTGEGFDASEDGSSRGTPVVAVCATGQVTHSLTTRSAAEEDGTGRGNPIVAVDKITSFRSEMGGNDGGVYSDGTTPTCTTAPPAIAFSCKDNGRDATEGVTPTLRSMGHSDSHANGGGQMAVAFDTTQITSKANRSNPKPGDPCHPITSEGHPPAVAFQTRIARNGHGQPEEICPALASEATGDSRPCVMTKMVVRRLTPRECERLQGFPDDYTAITLRGKPAADGPRYKALGNSMACNVMAWIGQRIAEVSKIPTK